MAFPDFRCIMYNARPSRRPVPATQGECASYPTLMNKMCPSACGICFELEVFYRRALGGDKEKDAV